MRLIVWFLLLAATLEVANAGTDRGQRDGNWWRAQTDARHTFYIDGFVDGIDLGNKITAWGLPTIEEQAKTFARYSKDSDKWLGNATIGQICDGLNSFYEDYRNRAIEIDLAVWVVLHSISGDSDEDVKAMTEAYRKNH